jgi:hypothetical protein
MKNQPLVTAAVGVAGVIWPPRSQPRTLAAGGGTGDADGGGHPKDVTA